MNPSSTKKPAVLGGNPVFAEPIPFNSPTLPPFKAVEASIKQVFTSGQLTNGPNVRSLEAKASDQFGRPAVAVASCTSGLILAAKVLGLTGQVILPSFTFFASSHSLIWNNLQPLFVDIEPDSWNIDPRAVEAAINPEVSAILAVDVFGNPSAKDELARIAHKHGLKLITDAAHALGATYKGEPVGGFGDAEVFSLSPTKLVAAGEGGLVGIANEAMAEELRTARDYGNSGDYDCRMVGLNARMAEINAVLALAGLDILADNVNHRARIAAVYKEGLSHLPGLTWQKIDSRNTSTFKDVSCVVDPGEFGLNRDQLGEALVAEGIPTRNYFHPAAHLQTGYSGLISLADRLEVTENISNNIISMPIFSHMDDDTIGKVCEAITRIHASGDILRTNSRA